MGISIYTHFLKVKKMQQENVKKHAKAWGGVPKPFKIIF
jgi:hypothetical protein